ncbi:MAG: RHS repeat-associated core domain-containing protein [Xanthomonadaceae bacterium]|nr:RHS repeat-associated core domain-containing protein [Xanthomonadaceae bacterium]MDP2185989.1 RHS repeat-associated core domain-containing protein [Xanthomonadales bacterium]MDZ4115732.1 RHS repeat-associated core domain-containing protein [Xanthomonadaceae bacterium]MDZ4377973.1 RHS repeat-associated core domain-containing protein [Xanthomonadaceae bacterium]
MTVARHCFSRPAGNLLLHGNPERTAEPFFLPQAASAGAPAFGGGNPCLVGRDWTLNSYDVVNRVIRVTPPDGSVQSVAYTGLTASFTDALNHNRTETRNALGELISATDAGGLTTSYSYDAAGNLLAVSRDAGRGAIVNTQSYDVLGRKIAQHDPDAGDWLYAYNALGEQVVQFDEGADPIRIEQWRDARGRVYRQRSGRLSAPELEHTYAFDTATPGQLSEERSLGGYGGVGGVSVDFRRSFNYDTLGRVIGSTTTTEGISYHALTQYDALGRAWRSQDPSGAWLKTEFDARGYAVRLCDSSAGDSGTTCASGSASTWLETLLTDARGNVLHERRGGNAAIELRRQYDLRNGRLLGQCTGIDCRLQDEQYEWDRAGNLLARDKAGQYREVFRYDALNRLTQSRYERIGSIEYGPDSGPVSSTQSYDKLGNLCSKLIAGEAQGYRYGGLAGCGLGALAGGSDGDGSQSPHAVIGLDHASFQYDVHGNQTDADYFDESQPPRSIAYSTSDQAWQIVQAWNSDSPQLRTRFWYGPDGSRYQRMDEGQGITPKRTLTIGNLEIVSQGGVTKTKRYVAGIVVQELAGSTAIARFMLHDHLGSVVALVDGNAQLVEAMDYGAFGERRGNVVTGVAAVVSQFTPRGFTGHEMIDGSDIIHMNGRIYDHRLGRFLQADPIIQEPNNPQNFNRYSYVLNNPLSLTDPSGFLFGGIGKLFKKIRPLAGLAVAIYAPGLLAPYLGDLGAAAATGFLAGSVGSGSLSGGLTSAFFGYTFVQALNDAGAQRVAGILSDISLLASVLNGDLSDIRFDDDDFEQEGLLGRIVRRVSGVVAGGGASAQTGGKFVNGAGSQSAARAGGLFSTGSAIADFGLGFIPGVSLVQALTDPSASALDVAFGALDLLPGGGRLFSLGARGIRSVVKLGRATKASKAASALPDSALVIRGGGVANQTAAKINSAIGPSRTLGVEGFSAQCNGGTCLAELGQFLRNRELGVTTVGEIRRIGGDVIPTPGFGHHVTVTGVSGEGASPLFQIVTNPNPLRGQ